MNENLVTLAGSKSGEFHSDIDWWPGRMLVILRENMGYSRQHVSDKLEISIGRIANYETGKTRMSSEVISKAADFFGVLPAAFFKKINMVGEVDQVLDRIAFDYEFEQMLHGLKDEQRRKLLDVASILF